MKVKRSYGERIGYAIILIVMITYALTTLYPFWHVLMYSISDSGRAMTGGLFFLPLRRVAAFLPHRFPNASDFCRVSETPS